MRWLSSLVGLAALTNTVSCKMVRRQFDEPPPDSSTYLDPMTGITFSSYSNDYGIAYNIAIPDTDKAPYDAILQIVAPKKTGWAAISWGGTMTYVPLTIAWANGTSVVVSSRMAYGYYVPAAYADASYTILEGTGSNETHWYVTTLCQGCTSWGNIYDDEITSIDTTMVNTLAFAFSLTPVDTPASNTSSFAIHDLTGHWMHDFTQARQKDFENYVTKNLPPGVKRP